jgi:hypothetical protein
MKRLFTATVFMFLLAPCSSPIFAQSESREGLLNEFEAKRAELATIENKLVLPADSDRQAFAEFLRQPDTGLVRLLPREVYDPVESNKGFLSINGGGAFYSFVRLTHDYGQGSDILLSRGYLSVGFAGTNYGILAQVGNIDLNEISVEHPGTLFLASYQAATEEPAARQEWSRFSSGITIDGIKYSNRVKAEVGMSYVLRSIDYGRSDWLVALKVVRQDSDGSLIIAWKALKKFPTPQWARR